MKSQRRENKILTDRSYARPNQTLGIWDFPFAALPWLEIKSTKTAGKLEWWIGKGRKGQKRMLIDDKKWNRVNTMQGRGTGAYLAFEWAYVGRHDRRGEDGGASSFRHCLSPEIQFFRSYLQDLKGSSFKGPKVPSEVKADINQL